MGDDFLPISLIVLILFWMCVDNEGVIKGDGGEMPQMWWLFFIEGRYWDVWAYARPSCNKEVVLRWMNGAGGGIWTLDLLITNQLLYHWATPAYIYDNVYHFLGEPSIRKSLIIEAHSFIPLHHRRHPLCSSFPDFTQRPLSFFKNRWSPLGCIGVSHLPGFHALPCPSIQILDSLKEHFFSRSF